MQQEHQDFQEILKQAYRYLHQHPELSFQETETTAWLRARLGSLGIETLDTGLSTGLVAIIRGDQAGKTVALRADIDALPVHEETALPYASAEQGVMHACGHDFHTSALLGAATLLQQNRASLKGSVKLVFQPAEEHSGGAKLVLKTGMLADVSEIYGLHVMPMIPSGTVALRSGANHAAVGWFTIRISGRGGHAALPHTCADPIVALGQLIGALQTVVSRAVDPFENVVVSVTHVSAGSTWNVIPSEAFLEGTFRVFSNELATVVSDRIANICSGVAQSSGTEISLDWKVTTPATNNASDLVSFAAETARSLGLPPTDDLLTMTGEDFAEYQRTIPGVFVHFGIGGDKPLHNPAFLADEAQLSRAARYLASLASKSLERLQ
jgi:amidohydrolase